jgi:hypothetical protein
MVVDQRIESFLTDVLALAGEDPDAIRKGVRVALADCEAIFRAQEVNTRMRGQICCHLKCRLIQRCDRVWSSNEGAP